MKVTPRTVVKVASRIVVDTVFATAILVTGSAAAAIVDKHGAFWASVAWVIGATSASSVIGRARGRWQARNRSVQLAACAQWLNLQYSDDTTPAAISKGFLSRAGATPLKGVIRGNWRGLPVSYQEYRSMIVDGRVFFFSVVCSHLNITAPYIEVSRKSRIRFAQLARSQGAPEADLDTGSFSREFRVKSKDDQFTRKLMDADMMAWMLSDTDNPKARFEIAEHQLIVSYRMEHLDPTILPSLLDAAAGFAAHIPRAVFDDYSIE